MDSVYARYFLVLPTSAWVPNLSRPYMLLRESHIRTIPSILQDSRIRRCTSTLECSHGGEIGPQIRSPHCQHGCWWAIVDSIPLLPLGENDALHIGQMYRQTLYRRVSIEQPKAECPPACFRPSYTALVLIFLNLITRCWPAIPILCGFETTRT